MIRAYKIRLNPNNKQRSQLEQSAHVARRAYNWALNQKKAHYEETGKSYSPYDLRKHLTMLKQSGEHAWLYRFSNNITKQAIKDCEEALKRFFKGHAQFPRFKSRRRSKWSSYQDPHKVNVYRELHGNLRLWSVIANCSSVHVARQDTLNQEENRDSLWSFISFS